MNNLNLDNDLGVSEVVQGHVENPHIFENNGGIFGHGGRGSNEAGRNNAGNMGLGNDGTFGNNPFGKVC